MQRDSVTNNESLSSGSVADFERNGSEFVADFERNGSEFVADSAGSTMYFAGDFSRSVAFKKFLLVAISIFSFGTILAGCNILPDTKTVQSYDGEFADFKEVPEISKMVPDSIRQTGKLTAGVNAGYAPAEVIVTNEITGYEVDLFIAISRVLGLEPEMLQAEFDSIVPAVGYKYNLGISAFTITDERKEVVDFIPAFHVGEAFAVQAGNPSNVSDPSEDEFALCGMRVGVQIGTVEELELDDSSEKCVEAGQEPIESWRWPMDMQAATALNGGRIDILYTDLPIVNYLEKQTQGDIIGWGKPVNFAYHGIAINKNDVELREAVRAALIYLMDNGIYSDIMKYWGQSNIAFEDESQVDTQQEFYENKSEEQILREKSIEIDSEFVANN